MIAQARVAVLPGDDAAALAQRVLEREHPLLVETLHWIAAGRLVLEGGGAIVDGAALPVPVPLQLNADNHFVTRDQP